MNQITSYVRIDSSDRIKESQNTYDKLINLESYPIKFTNGSKRLTIMLENNTFSYGDKIVLQSVSTKNLMLRNSLSVKKSSMYVRIKCENHGMSVYDLYDNNDYYFKQVDFVSDLPETWKPNDVIPDPSDNNYVMIDQPIKYTIQISGITDQYIGNIPTIYLNTMHRVVLLFRKVKNKYIMDNSNFLIELIKPSSINYSDQSNIYIRYDYLYGIPISAINGTDTHYFDIVSTTNHSFSIDIEHAAIVDPDNSFFSTNDLIEIDEEQQKNAIIYNNRGGGSQMFVRRISSIIPGYPNSNHYTISLGRTFRNVVSVRLISSTFPNSQRIINQSNNKIQWRNLSDGNHVYQITIDPGNYSKNELINALETAFRQTKRINYSEHTDPYHNIKVCIDEATDVVSFSSFNSITLADSLIDRPVLTVADQIVDFVIEPNFHSRNILIYLTSQSVIDSSRIPFVVHNLYQSNEIEDTSIRTFLSKTRVLINMLSSIKGSDIIHSINTDVALIDFNYDYLTRTVTRISHSLNNNDIIITDRFVDIDGDNIPTVYTISDIIDGNSFIVKKIEPNDLVIIYDNMIINSSDAFEKELNVTSIKSIIPQITHNNELIVYHPDHQMKNGNIIEISGSKSVNAVPSDIINGYHTINQILDDNSYMIKLPIYIPDSYIDLEPNVTRITYPDIFQLIINKHHSSIGNILGFRNIGNTDSITQFKHIIKNTDPYINELDRTYYILPKLNMSGQSYFYICSNVLSCIYNTSSVKNVFAMIRWTDNPGSIIFDSFVPTIKTFNQPLEFLSELEIEIIDKNGSYIDFNGLDHSFVLEIVED